jgi:hypothetical protein
LIEGKSLLKLSSGLQGLKKALSEYIYGVRDVFE